MERNYSTSDATDNSAVLFFIYVVVIAISN